MYEVEDVSSRKDQRLKSLRLIELSDHIIRLNRRENTQLELRLRQLKRQEMIMKRIYDRNIYFQRLHLNEIYESFNNPFTGSTPIDRTQTPTSFYAIKMQRNQSAPPPRNNQRTPVCNSRPNTTPTPIRRTKRSMSVFKELTLKPECQTLGNMLLFVNNSSESENMPVRSKTMIQLKTTN